MTPPSWYAYAARALERKAAAAVESAIESGDSRATEYAIRNYFQRYFHVVAGCAHGGCRFSADPCPCWCHE